VIHAYSLKEKDFAVQPVRVVTLLRDSTTKSFNYQVVNEHSCLKLELIRLILTKKKFIQLTIEALCSSLLVMTFSS
jgi:hypothetical protein